MAENRSLVTKMNIIIIGDSGTGKTSLKQQFVYNHHHNIKSTVGVDMLCKDIQVHGKEVQLLLWDTYGMERYSSVLPQLYRNAHGVIVVYDVTDRTSITGLDMWLEEARSNSRRSNVVMMLIGNKIDVANREVTLEGERFARQHQMLHFECSAVTGACVQLAFKELAKKIIETQDLDESEKNSIVSIKVTQEESKESMCIGFCSSRKINIKSEQRRNY